MTGAVTLDDKYRAEHGRVFLNGTQALVRMALLQKRRDRAAGLRTAGLVSGYRGSPLGTIDMEMGRARGFLEAHDIRFVPGVNEDLAATALWGSQQIHLQDQPEWDGVFGLWYGKGPGVDRTGDAFRHANLAGSAARGGVLVLAGDDHTCKSSTTSHQSEYALVDAMMPILSPAGVPEMIEYGLHGWALSRLSGCWTAMKVTADLTDRSVSMTLDPAFPVIRQPADLVLPPGGLNIRWPDSPQEQEARLHLHKIPAALAYVRANGLNRVALGGSGARFGIVTAGKAYLDVRQALAELGIGEGQAAALGIAVFKVAVPWPLEPDGLCAFAAGLDEILVVEEKRPLIEGQIKDILYGVPADRRPRVTGKSDDSGAPMLRSHDELSVAEIARAIARRLARCGVEVDAAALARLETPGTARAGGSVAKRTPYFCSGCPHNSSTRVPEGSRAHAGIGCHWMSQAMDRDTATYTHMGAEGANWVGLAPFVSTRHIFQNIGDGTYFHSGLLAIRAAVAGGVNITYKILFNDAVAMTGGQSHDGQLTPQAIAWQVRAEGVQRIAVVSDEPEKYGSSSGLPPYVTIHHRDELDAVQREFREVPGVSALIYDQTCAAEKRRRRKRGRMPDPGRRVVINERVCEGCGDCSTQSNCLSVVPVDTEFGTKRTIDQSSCNKDFSCVNGFCPSFVTVEGGTLRKSRPALAPAPAAGADAAADALPEPALPALDQPYRLLVTGVGGTGVVTIGAILGMAAHLEGMACSILDQTGMAQKGGAVMSHIVLARLADQIHAARIAPGGADAVLGCDLLVAAGEDGLSRMRAGRTRAVLNRHETVTGAFTRNPDERLPLPLLVRRVADACGGGEAVDALDATAIATRLLGDAIMANLFLLGYAWQKGLIPLSASAIDEAIVLNGTGVAANRAAFAWGRRAAADPDAVPAQKVELLGIPPAETAPPADLDALISRRVGELTAYQDSAYAERYRRLVDQVRQAEVAAAAGNVRLTEAVARSFYKVMAYKDEYEVARLYTDGAFLARLGEQFETGFRLRFHLAPPMLAARDPQTGRLKKSVYGPWMLTAFQMLAKLRKLRGTPFDPFGRTAERRAERRLVDVYERAILGMLASLAPETLEPAVRIASIPERIRGYGHVKEKAMAQAEAELHDLLAQFHSTPMQRMAAE
ncbi:indolepyruvate ferredoxin oxidoreductase family protein [Azospirillum sp. B21]|nr:indolepyruvate ferredoxin oxidoreductase family protein [Azospirillum sp. B21]